MVVVWIAVRVTVRANTIQNPNPNIIGVRDGGGGGGGSGGAVAPPQTPIRAVCRHQFGQRVDIIRAKHNTCLINTS